MKTLLLFCYCESRTQWRIFGWRIKATYITQKEQNEIQKLRWNSENLYTHYIHEFFTNSIVPAKATMKNLSKYFDLFLVLNTEWFWINHLNSLFWVLNKDFLINSHKEKDINIGFFQLIFYQDSQILNCQFLVNEVWLFTIQKTARIKYFWRNLYKA